MTRRGRPPYPDVLTPREWEVLSLIRQGLTNREIAERLGISLSGAKHHVSEIISKLGVEGREEAASWRPERGLPTLLAPLAWILRPGRLAEVTVKVAISLAVLALVITLVVASTKKTSSVAPALRSQDVAATPTVEPAPEPQRSTVAGYDLGYGAGGGAFVALEGNVLTLEEQVGSGTISYVIDAETRLLWADDGRIRWDNSREGLTDGTFITFSFDSPLDGDFAAANGIPLDTVVIGYFKYMDGEIVTIGDTFIDVRLNPQLVDGIGAELKLSDGVVRVWLDPQVEVQDNSATRTGMHAGLRIGFSGLINAQREPVTNWIQIR